MRDYNFTLIFNLIINIGSMIIELFALEILLQQFLLLLLIIISSTYHFSSKNREENGGRGKI